MTIFDDLIPEPLPAGVKVLYGTVTGSSPLRVQVDGDPGPLPVTPTTTVATAVGDRVVLLSHPRASAPSARARAVVIVGVIGTGLTAWQSPTLLNGWSGFLQVRRGPAGIEVRINALSAAAASNAQVTTLPLGFRPAEAGELPVRFTVHNAATTPEIRRGQIDTSGNLYIYDYTSTTYYGRI